jgi:hypothetical protein
MIDSSAHMMRSCLCISDPRHSSGWHDTLHPPLLRLSDRHSLLPIRPAGLLWPLDAVDTTISQTKQLQRKGLQKRWSGALDQQPSKAISSKDVFCLTCKDQDLVLADH